MPSGVYIRTKETRIKISNIHKGMKHTKETRMKMSEVHKGFKHTEEAKRKMRKSSKGQVAWNKGRTDLPSPSQETIQKRRLKMLAEKNPSWAADKIGYGGVHNWIAKKYGVADCCENKQCSKKSITFEWANISGKYRRDRKDFMKLCRSCHRKFDNGSLSLESIKG